MAVLKAVMAMMKMLSLAVVVAVMSEMVAVEKHVWTVLKMATIRIIAHEAVRFHDEGSLHARVDWTYHRVGSVSAGR